MALRITMHKHVTASVVCRVLKSGLKKEFSNLPAPYQLPDLEGTQLQGPVRKHFAPVIYLLVFLNYIYAKRRHNASIVPINPRVSALPCFFSKPFIKRAVPLP